MSISLKIRRYLQRIISPFNKRSKIADQWLKGSGIEIGALHSPLRVNSNVDIKYVDRMANKELRQHYPELASLPLVEVDIIDNGEHLSSFVDNSEDFIIGNHLLEHCQDPIKTLKEWHRVLKPGGVAFISVPLKSYTFDHLRKPTTWQHVVSDHQNGPETSRKKHFQEWVQLVEKTPQDSIENEIERLMQMNYSIHFHVYTLASFSEFISNCIHEMHIPFTLELVTQNQFEAIAILRKQ